MSEALTDAGNFRHNNTTAPSCEKVLPLFSNKGKTAIVSGAGAGIGLAVAQALAESGANVAIWYNSNKKAIDRAKDIEKDYGVKCELAPIACDFGLAVFIYILIRIRNRQCLPSERHRCRCCSESGRQHR